jgi:hypothetical protein
MVAIIGAIAIFVSCDRLKGCRLTAVEALVLVQVPGNFIGPTTYSLRSIESVIGKTCPPHKHVFRTTLSMRRREYTLQTPECLTDRNRTGGRAAHADAAALDRDPFL